MDNEIRWSQFSVLLAYQIAPKLSKWFSIHEYHIHASTVVLKSLTIPFIAPLPRNILSSFYTIWADYVKEISLLLYGHNNRSQTDAFVMVYDGPILVKYSTLNEISKGSYRYKTGFRAKIGIQLNDHASEEVCHVRFHTDTRYPESRIISKLSETLNVSFNTMQRSANQVLYYKSLLVSSFSFVKMTFTNIRQYQGESPMCENGGFILSDFSMYKMYIYVTGPFCTKRGTEPLVNAVRSFQSSSEFIVFILYSYTFWMF